MTVPAIPRLLGSIFIAGALALAASEPEDGASKKQKRRVRLGAVVVGVGYAHSTGYPGFWPYPYWSRWTAPWFSPFYDPWWGGGFFHPGYFTGFPRGANMGEVKLRGDLKDADVYLDGAYAGAAGKLKSIWLQAGAYNLELRAANESYRKRIYVLTGKRLDIRPEFARKESEQ